MTLAQRVLRTIRRYDMVPRGGRVVVALSGGADSVALLHLLREPDLAGELALAGVAHVNHQLRGEAAAADEAFCRAAADSMGIPVEVFRADVRAVARDEGRSIEDAGRRLRYEFLEAAADRLEAQAIAIGHSLDDQAETFLLRLLRGAGTRGLGAIRPKLGRVVRPLLEIRRAELRQYAADRCLTWQEDATNADTSVPRNRVRHELLPFLVERFSPAVVEVLAREAALARDDDDLLEREAIELAPSRVLRGNPGAPGEPSVRVEARALTSLHPALASRIARRALQEAAGGRFIGFEHVASFLDFVRTGSPGQALSLPGQQVIHRGDTVAFGPEPPRGLEEGTDEFRVLLAVPGEVNAGDWSVRSDWSEGSDGSMAIAALVRGSGALAVRFRKPGDRFDPPGMGGRSKKLQDYLVDRKVVRAERDRLPLVVDEDDRIVWVVGHGVSEGRRASEPSPGVILLKARRLGGEV